jgi:hypothetical protein
MTRRRQMIMTATTPIPRFEGRCPVFRQSADNNRSDPLCRSTADLILELCCDSTLALAPFMSKRAHAAGYLSLGVTYRGEHHRLYFLQDSPTTELREGQHVSIGTWVLSRHIDLSSVCSMPLHSLVSLIDKMLSSVICVNTREGRAQTHRIARLATCLESKPKFWPVNIGCFATKG